MQRGIIAAKFGIPAAGEDVTFTLSVSGGSLEENLRRWEGQFSGGTEPRRESISTQAGDATVVYLQGQFSPGMGRPAAQGWSMVGVVLPLDQQNYYVKLTGPTDQVGKAEQDFLTFCKSARQE